MKHPHMWSNLVHKCHILHYLLFKHASFLLQLGLQVKKISMTRLISQDLGKKNSLSNLKLKINHHILWSAFERKGLFFFVFSKPRNSSQHQF